MTKNDFNTADEKNRMAKKKFFNKKKKIEAVQAVHKEEGGKSSYKAL